MEFYYDKTEENIKDILNQEIKSHKKYGVYNEIDGTVDDDKVTLFVKSDIPVLTGTYFKNYFSGKITEVDGETEIKGRFSMKPYKIVLLLILFLLCVEVIIFNLVCSRPIQNIVPAAIILAAEAGLMIVQNINAKKEKKILVNFLKRI